ncbi:Dihydroxyacetone kinase 2 [Scheffersomyces spartinae]|uniref:Dihydroxyacetone kinase n=1 Tax=Scheffersomyces spartinae TaxID=45513 RepID=A0A9P8AJN2_9ASCO|nr:Dihydroxyacetone kinase 2 [Scheffersomyces spartinae]KAG7195059.1 Dihydroxyacetone kinase 2 [Scheffersomyces spartinae]
MPSHKHWKYHHSEDIVLSNLRGLALANPHISVIPSEKVVFNSQSQGDKKVTLISGGGAGHEPLHGGYVGENLLDAAVSGHIFASPNTNQILAAVIQKTNKQKGAVIVVKNYTGDILHFGLVVERAKALGYPVEMVIVADDVAVGRSQNAMVGRRGLAGTALIHKILGYASHSVELDSLASLGRDINENLVTIGASLDRTSIPNSKEGGEEVETTALDEYELGLGIHNEPGEKLKLDDIDNIVKQMFEKLVSPNDPERHYVDFSLDSDETVLLINNIGGTSSLEMNVLVDHIVSNYPFKIAPKRVLVSDFVTSLNAPGFSITIMNLTGASSSSSKFSQTFILEALDAPTNAPGWKPKIADWQITSKEVDSPMESHSNIVSSELRVDDAKLRANIQLALKKVIEWEPKITHYDTLVGDGDCGETLVAGANGILNSLANDKDWNDHLNDPVYTLSHITEIIEKEMGGTSGGIYSIFFTSLVFQLQKIEGEFSTTKLAEALYLALHEGLFKYTKARVGGRTLIDALQPFIDILHESGDTSRALQAAQVGCENTKKMKAKFGRASYVSSEQFEREGGIPDPGAVGVVALLTGFLKD